MSESRFDMRNLRLAGPLTVVAVLACCWTWVDASGVGGQDPVVKRSIKDGVYTELQANRGEREYGRTCEHCHGAGLEGDAGKEIPPLVSDPFLRKWNGKSLMELFELLSRSMPADNRGSLSARTYTDLIAYLLRVNDAPAGSSALPNSPEGLEGISIEKP